MPKMVVLPDIRLAYWLVASLKFTELTTKKYLHLLFATMLFRYFLLLLLRITEEYINWILLLHFLLEN